MINFLTDYLDKRKTEKQNTLKRRLANSELQVLLNAGFISLSMILRDDPTSRPEPFLGSRAQHDKLYSYLKTLLENPEASQDAEQIIALLDQHAASALPSEEKRNSNKAAQVCTQPLRERLVKAIKPYINPTPGADFKMLIDKAERKTYYSLSEQNMHSLFCIAPLTNLISDYAFGEEVAALLKAVADATPDQEQDPTLIKTMAEKLIKPNPILLTRAGSVTDLAGRTFETTAFQYALWAGDWHLCNIIIMYMDPEEAKKQFQQLEDKGVEYTYSDKKEEKDEAQLHKHHFSLQPLLNAYVHLAQAFNADDWNLVKIIWIKEIGGAQAVVPACVAQQYCHPSRSFEAGEHTIFSGPLPRPLETDKGGWFSATYSDGKIGESFAFWRSDSSAEAAKAIWPPSVRRNSTSVQSLENTRAEQLNLLAASLGVTMSQEHSSAPRP